MAEIANALHLRDFRIAAILEFFNTIGAKRTLAKAPMSPKCHFRTSVAATTSPVSAGLTRPNRSRKGAVFLAEHTTRATTDKIV